MDRYKVGLLCFQIFANFLACNCKDIYVSSAGKDNGYCGNNTFPCQTLNHAAEVIAEKHDVIKIDGQSGEILISRPISFEDEISDMTFTSYNGRPTLTSLNNHDLYLVETHKNISLTFSELGFYNIQLIKVHHNINAIRSIVVAVRLYECNLRYDTTSSNRSNQLLHIDGNYYIHFYMKIENCYVGSSSSVSILKSIIHESFMMKVTNSSLHNVSSLLILPSKRWYPGLRSYLFSVHIENSVLNFQDDTIALLRLHNFRNKLISFDVFEINIAGCVFSNTKSILMVDLRSMNSYYYTAQWKVSVKNSMFFGKHVIGLANVVALVMIEGFGKWGGHKMQEILIANCVFMNSIPILKITTEVLLKLSVNVKNSTFVGKHEIRETNGVALIMVEPWALSRSMLEILIANCVFVINIPILKVWAHIRLSINNSTFVGNYGIRMTNGFVGSTGTTTNNIALMMIEARDKASKITIADCIFLNSGFVLNAKDIMKLFLLNTKFVGHSRARGRSVTAENTENIHIVNCIFKENQVVSKSLCGGDRKLSGNGGALLILGKTRIVIEDSLFVNNSASCVGDSIYIDSQKNIELRNTSFKSFKLSSTSRGIIWYSRSSKISFDNVSFKATYTTRRSRTIYTADANHIAVRNVAPYFRCPRGANVKVYPKTKHNTLSKVECNFCPDKTYTLEESYATVTNFNDSHRGIHSAKCQPCPFGATCISMIRPKKNFWGYIYKKRAHLISCPPGHCCQTNEGCRSLESCNIMRRGVLCGECSKGYSQSVFSGTCIKDSQCNAWIFWGVLIAVCFGLLLTIAYLQDILAVLFRRLKLKAMMRCLPRRSNSTNSRVFIATDEFPEEQDPTSQVTPNLERTDSESSSLITSLPRIETQKNKENTSTTSGLIKILFFYYQMNALLVIYKSEYQLIILNQIKTVFNNLFTFNANSETLSKIGCPFSDMDNVRKRLIKACIPCIMLGLAGALLLIVAVCGKCIKSAVMSNYVASLRNRILVTILQIILLGYSSLTSNIFALLTCVSMVNGTKILFIQGNINCYETWQFILLSFVIVWSLPLTVALYMASKRVKEKVLTIKGFFCALLFPLPCVVYFIFKRAVRQDETSELIESQSLDDVYHPVSPTTDALEPLLQTTEQPQPQLPRPQQQQQNLREKLLHILASSFRCTDKDGGRLQWEPVLIAQRLVLLTLHAFLTNPIIKALSMLAAVILIICINIAVKPFHSILLNGLNTMYLLFLCMSGITNSLYAYIYIGETKPSGPVLDTLRVLDIIELAMQLLFPCVAVAAVMMIIITKLFHLLYSLLLNVMRRCKRCMT
eukprot:Seg3464.2 transcript_id=Seg3464.2/GoldUCD/mRNA.D3Y31 product="hypothetical protein" protein_id=Seg3464.2/GoldUCD/D3Y31